MANHGWITARKNLKPQEVLKDLQEINERRFKGLLTITETELGEGGWSIDFNQEGRVGLNGFDIWICSPRKLEHRHANGWAFYLEVVFTNELGAKYDATLSDEGIDDKWKPNPKKYPTYRAWLDVLHSTLKKKKSIKYKQFYKEIIDIEMKWAPEELRYC
jgi:hypothetical protein